MGDLGRGVRADRERAPEQVGDRPVRAVRVVGRASGARHPCSERARIGEQLVDKTRFPKAGLADDRDDVTLSGERLVEGAQEKPDLVIASDQRRATAIDRGRFDTKEPPGHERSGLALRGDRRMRLVREEARREPIGCVAD